MRIGIFSALAILFLNTEVMFICTLNKSTFESDEFAISSHRA